MFYYPNVLQRSHRCFYLAHLCGKKGLSWVGGAREGLWVQPRASCITPHSFFPRLATLGRRLV